VASLLLSIEAPSPALADAPPAGSSQGAVLEELLKQQQEGKGTLIWILRVLCVGQKVLMYIW
jgi:hypothetical protein